MRDTRQPASQGRCAPPLGALCSRGPCEPPPPAFPTGSRAYSRAHTHANAPPEAAPTPGQGAPVPRQGPSGYSSAPFCCLIRLSAAERVAWWRWGDFCREGGQAAAPADEAGLCFPRVTVQALPVPRRQEPTCSPGIRSPSNAGWKGARVSRAYLTAVWECVHWSE